MSNLTKLESNALDITGNNYLTWILDAEIHLNAMGLGDTIKVGYTKSEQDKAKAMIFLRHHLQEGLKTEYLTDKDPSTLWKDLKETYDHQKMVILPKARYDWIHLYKDMLEKTYSTFHTNNMLLQQQYRERRFTKYSELISVLLLAEQNNELLMKNHQVCPTGSTPFPETNVMTGGDYGCGQGFDMVVVVDVPVDVVSDMIVVKITTISQTLKRNLTTRSGQEREKPKGSMMGQRAESICHRCEMKGNWSRTCRTSKHLVDLYQASLKGVETNFTEQTDPLGLSQLEAHFGGENQIDPLNSTHMEVSDFFEDGNMEVAKFVVDGAN
ncbi:uncharacterized protein LOC141701742 [Apium graveolens]|uniref:uncharacterized protein LOC141701742 n=1 Tax=Apium graveolens TaxID=4045 RepID=UPI003D7910A0